MKALAAALLLFLALPAAAKSRKKPHAPKKAPVEVSAPLHPPRVSTEPITFVWPAEGATVAADADFVFGSVAVATAPFTINGATITVNNDGGFLAWLPISSGTFTFHAELKLSSGAATADRHIFVPPPPAPLPDSPAAIDPSSLSPRADLELRAGDWWTIRMKATRGRRAWARVPGEDWREMRETNPALGIYELNLRVAPGQRFGPAPIEYRLGGGWSSVRATGVARVSAGGDATTVATARAAAGYANLKTGPNDGFLIFPPNGARMAVTGRDGASVRVELAPYLTGWVDAKDVTLSTGAAQPLAHTGNVGVTTDASGATVRVALSERVPFEVVEDDDLNALTLRLFGAVGHTNLVIFDGGESDFVEQIHWRQEADGVVVLRVRLKPGRRLWGYLARYDAGGSVRLQLRREPRVDRRRPLAGLRVMLDPGHMPSAPGAIGPLGTKEMDANYAIAQAAAALLKREGAVPLLTRRSSADEVSLTDRPRQAAERDADLFVSLHNNALPDGTNPFAKPRGFTVFYYHPHSLALGRAVHEAYHAAVPLPDEGLQWDNLLVARLTSAPAILVENAYIIVPEQEALLNDAQFRQTLAKSLVAGLKSFMAGVGRKQRK
ncbi:MAG: N-acetylmuramoyl-L-alanine amidase [Elusimicrobia bacterium]|nr:N-acetylmuramoyl-L-alanine amidase [Elusimicrobiota bacterium]